MKTLTNVLKHPAAIAVLTLGMMASDAHAFILSKVQQGHDLQGQSLTSRCKIYENKLFRQTVVKGVSLAQTTPLQTDAATIAFLATRIAGIDASAAANATEYTNWWVAVDDDAHAVRIGVVYKDANGQTKEIFDTSDAAKTLLTVLGSTCTF